MQPLRVGEIVVLAGEEAEVAPRKEAGVEGLWLWMGGFLRGLDGLRDDYVILGDS